MKKDIYTALTEVLSPDDIYFMDSRGKLFQNETSEQVGSMLSSFSALGHHFAQQDADVLYLGLEGFHLISSHTWQTSWKSPWGDLDVQHKKTRPLLIQPTLGIKVNDFGHFDFSSQGEGWEPGPMFLGRGQKMTLIDFWSENPKFTKTQGLCERISAQGVTRFKNAVMALTKISKNRDADHAHVTKQLQSLAMQKLAMEAYLHRCSEKLVVAGPLASVFANAFKKDANTSLHEDEYIESRAIALCGAMALAEGK
jgi:N-methylhydantoinase A